MSHLLARLRSAFTPAKPPPDVELLSRFLDHNDQDAFTELVRRYGPMVLGVCRRILGDGPDAEDAYQAVFLVLAKRAASVRVIGRIGGWLHGVATLTAKKARGRCAKRHVREQAAGVLTDIPARQPEPSDLTAVLDEALAAIPEKYRTAVVLCELLQLTLDQAAAELGVPRGTVASRLARGREALGKRLLRRGLFSFAAPVLSVEPLTVDPTPSAQSLSREVLRTMTASHLRWLPLAVLPFIAVAAGLLAADPPKPTAPPPKAEEKAKRNATVARVKLVGIGGLLEQPAIRKQLALTDKQDEQLKAAREEVAKGMKAMMDEAKLNQKNFTDLSDIQLYMERLGDTANDYDTKASKIITPEQAYRLKQVMLQREGPTAYLNRYAVRELALTPEQEDKIGESVGPLTRPKFNDITLSALAMPEDPKAAKLIQQRAAALDDMREAAVKHLTADQKAKWKEMVGEEVATAILVVASADAFVMRLALEAGK